MPRLLELDGVLQQRMRADDDARLAGGDLVADLPLLLRRHRSGQQRDPRRALDAAELTGHRQRAEHVADRSGHVGRQGLPSAPAARTGSRRRPSAASPAPRRSSFPNPPRPAASGSSGAVVGEFGRQHVEHFASDRRSVRTATAATNAASQPAVPPRRRPDPISLELRRACAPPAPTAGRRASSKVRRSCARSRSASRSRRGGSRAAPRPRRSDSVAAERFRQRIVERDRARRAPGAHTRRCPSSAPWRWRG